MRSLLFVFFSYASKAALRIDWKLEEEEEEEKASGKVWDMVRVERVRMAASCSVLLIATDMERRNAC